jgi:hypothetical protein
MKDQFKKILPGQFKEFANGIKKFTKRNLDRIIRPFGKKVFCISMQRTGTTSVGDFLDEHGYRVARWGDSHFYNWSYLASIGDYESIFDSNAFRSYNAFEDGPWFHEDIYRLLFHRFPESKFILLRRDSNAWFNSMIRHSDGKVLGNTYRHCKRYRRLDEYYDKVDNDPDFKPTLNEIDNLLSLKGKKEHYIRIYETYHRDVIEYFRRYDKKSLFVGRLEDPDKWSKIGIFLNIEVDREYRVHSNKSDKLKKD